MSELSGRTILLTGASQGIGAETARILSSRGASLIAHYRGDRERRDAEDVLRDADPSSVHLLAADYLDDHQVDTLWRAAVEWRGRVDVLILNAAMMWPHGGVDDDDESWDKSWQEHYQVNVQAPARLMRSAVRHFRASGGGVIILLSSWVAQRGVTNPAMLPYAASKGAIKAVAQSIARGYAKENILTHIIAPGIVRTKMSTDFAALQGGEDAVTRTLAMGEWVPPREIAELVAFLSLGDARHLSGATLDVNGASYIR
jgi:NAD(P)-dependent dehydrogenase (short-subunit alcohol dehydrogenase family)